MYTVVTLKKVNLHTGSDFAEVNSIRLEGLQERSLAPAIAKQYQY